jgi:predicted nucleic acid-binding Zn ribbon protein
MGDKQFGKWAKSMAQRHFFVCKKQIEAGYEPGTKSASNGTKSAPKPKAPKKVKVNFDTSALEAALEAIHLNPLATAEELGISVELWIVCHKAIAAARKTINEKAQQIIEEQAFNQRLQNL